MQAFFPPFLSSLLNPGTAGKATHDKSTSNTFQGKHLPCSHSHLPRAGILGQAPSLPWPRQRLLALRQQRAGSMAGSAGLLCCLPAWWSLLAKFLVWGFSPLPPGVKTGVSLWLGEGSNPAHSHSSGAEQQRQSHKPAHSAGTRSRSGSQAVQPMENLQTLLTARCISAKLSLE